MTLVILSLVFFKPKNQEVPVAPAEIMQGEQVEEILKALTESNKNSPRLTEEEIKNILESLR